MKYFWNKTSIKPLGDIRISIKKHEYDIKPNIQEYFTNTNQTTKNMDNEDKKTIYDILTNTSFYSKIHTKGTKKFKEIQRCFL